MAALTTHTRIPKATWASRVSAAGYTIGTTYCSTKPPEYPDAPPARRSQFSSGVSASLEDPRFLSPEKARTDFHRGVLSALGEILGAHEAQDLLRRAVYTNVVKCSPVGKTIPFETKKTCYAAHLARELEYFKPRAIIAVVGVWDAYPVSDGRG
jgi:hypothetical protein